MKRMFLKKYLSSFCSRLQIWHPFSTRLPENEGKLNFVNNSVALQENFSGNNWKQYFQHFLNVSCANEWNEVTKGRQLAAS